MTAQEEFDEIYITSSEICRRLNVTRATLVHRRRQGLLPDPISVNDAQIQLWKRKAVLPYLNDWEQKLVARRQKLSA